MEQGQIEFSPEWNTERYRHDDETGFRLASEQPLSTFSIDVDTAMLLQQSQFAGALSFADVGRVARGALGADRDGYRHEFLDLVARARGTSLEQARR